MSQDQNQTVRRRARSEEDKKRVRETLIQTGRDLISQFGASNVSLRQVAMAAGYSPGLIYSYFNDQRDLFGYIRAHHLKLASDEFLRICNDEPDPHLKLRKLLYATVDHWTANLDHFVVIYPAPGLDKPKVPEGQVPF